MGAIYRPAILWCSGARWRGCPGGQTAVRPNPNGRGGPEVAAVGSQLRWRDGQARYLLRENAVRGYEVPTERNPLRSVASDDRFGALRKVSDGVVMELRWADPAIRQRATSRELLDLAHDRGDGSRPSVRSAMRSAPGYAAECPYGAIRWPEDTDKEGGEWVAPISLLAHSAVDRVLRDRSGTGAA